MNNDPVAAIEEYLKHGPYRKPLSTIKKEIEEFVKERDKNDEKNAKAYTSYRTETSYYVREGRVIYRDKLNE